MMCAFNIIVPASYLKSHLEKINKNNIKCKNVVADTIVKSFFFVIK